MLKSCTAFCWKNFQARTSSSCFILMRCSSLETQISPSSLSLLWLSSWSPSCSAAFSIIPGGKLHCKASSLLISIPLTCAKTIDFAIFSRSVLFPPLCLILMCRLRLPSLAQDFEHLAQGHSRARQISLAHLLLCFFRPDRYLSRVALNKFSSLL